MFAAPHPAVVRDYGRPLRVDVIGARGFNARIRGLPALAKHAGRLDLVGYDRVNGPAREHGIPVVRVESDAELAARLADRRPDVVVIETPDLCHPAHIALALAAGARLVLCEKCIATAAASGAAVRDACAAVEPGQAVRFIDHYQMLAPVRALAANAAAWLGPVLSVDVELFEPDSLPAAQDVSHAQGMTNFFHHVVALAGLWVDLADLTPVDAGWDRYPGARVPDTYRRAQFRDGRGRVVVGAVGKAMGRAPRKQIRVTGLLGHARIDRDRNVLEVFLGGDTFAVPGPPGDTGYLALAEALATGTPLPPLLRPDEALAVLRLVEAAHAMARRVSVYCIAPGRSGTSGLPVTGRSRARPSERRSLSFRDFRPARAKCPGARRSKWRPRVVRHPGRDLSGLNLASAGRSACEQLWSPVEVRP
jgi:predicted dehydrogenase